MRIFVEQRNRAISPVLYKNYSKLQNVIYFRLYSDFIREGRRCPALEAGHTKPADWERMEVETTENLRRLCQQLPHYHLKTLGFLCHHLNRISLNSEVNNMPSSNLAIGSFFFSFLTLVSSRIMISQFSRNSILCSCGKTIISYLLKNLKISFRIKKNLCNKFIYQNQNIQRSCYFNKMVTQNTLRSDVSAMFKSIHVREIVREFVRVKK